MRNLRRVCRGALVGYRAGAVVAACGSWVVVAGCAGGSGGPQVGPAVVPPKMVSVRFEGDSMVAGINVVPPPGKTEREVIKVYDWREDFPGAVVNGQSGAVLEEVRLNLGKERVDVAVLFAGFNNAKQTGESVDVIAAKYQLLYDAASLVAGKVLCIDIPLLVEEKSHPWFPAGVEEGKIAAVNQRIAQICGAGFVRGWLLDTDTDDGVHPNVRGYWKLVMALKVRM